MAHAHKPDCILLDYELPGTDGGLFAAYIRMQNELRKIPIVMISGHESQELVAYETYKVDAFLLKGTPLPKILAIVKSVMRRVCWEREILNKGDISLCGNQNAVLHNSKLVTVLSVDQFRFLRVLVENSPQFVAQEEVCRRLFGDGGDYVDRADAIKLLAYRLRCRLGEYLGRRIRSRKSRGWIYLNPEVELPA